MARDDTIRVLETGTGYACRFAGRALAQAGFDVTVAGSRRDHAWLDRSKGRVAPGDLHRFLQTVDVVVTDDPDAVDTVSAPPALAIVESDPEIAGARCAAPNLVS